MTYIDYKQMSLDFARSAQSWKRAAVTLAKIIHGDHADDGGDSWHECTHPYCVTSHEAIAAAASSGLGL